MVVKCQVKFLCIVCCAKKDIAFSLSLKLWMQYTRFFIRNEMDGPRFSLKHINFFISHFIFDTQMTTSILGTDRIKFI